MSFDHLGEMFTRDESKLAYKIKDFKDSGRHEEATRIHFEYADKKALELAYMYEFGKPLAVGG